MNVFNSLWGALPLINCLEMHLQKQSVHCICSRVSLWSLVRGVGAFTLGNSAGGTSIESLVLLQMQVTGPSSGDAVIVITKMLITSALHSRTSTSFDRQSTALLQALDIQLTVMLYVANSTNQWLTLLLAFLFRKFCKSLWSLCTMIAKPWG